MAIQEKYTGELREKLGYSATWLPMTHVRLGDVGRLDGYVYEYLGSLKDYGISFSSAKGASMGVVDHVSSEGVQISSRSHADVLALDPTAIGGTLSVKFSKQGAVLFRAEGCESEIIKRQNLIETEIIGMHERGAWPDGLVVVTEVVHAARAAIIVSSSSDATIELRGATDLAGLVTAGSRLEVVRSRDIATKIIMEGDLTPLFRAKGLRRRRFGTTKLERRGHGTAEQPQISEFGEVDYRDYA
jgi:hypothetical protein